MSKTTTDLATLKINLLSQADYEAEVQAGTVEANELYLTPQSGTGVTDVEVDGTSVVTGGVAEIDTTDFAEIVYCIYGVTSYSDIVTAIGNGKVPMVVDDGVLIPCSVTPSSNSIVFRHFASDSNVEYIVNSSGWTVNTTSFVPTSRTVNGKALSSNITLSASDVGALPSSTTIPTITDTYNGSSSNGMSGKAVKSAIDALDGTISGSAGSGKTLTAFSQTDGKVSATFGNISITKSQVSDFPTIPTVNDATLTIQKNGTTVNTFTANASSNVTANITTHDVPSGGTTGQVLMKNSNTDYDCSWTSLPIYNGGVS